MRLTTVVWGWWTMGDDRAVVGALKGTAALSGALRACIVRPRRTR
jgi:hypothetical protein